MIESPGGLTQRPSKIRPDKIVFRGGWENDSLYALMNLRYDGYHGYRATNCMITLHYGVPFVVEDIVKRKREWLPEGRKLVRDDDIERYRLNGFYIREPSLYRVINRMDIFRNRYFQTLPRHTKNNVFIKKENFDLSITEIVDWLGWDNKRICIRMGNDYIIVFDINKCKTPKEHNVIWHLKGEYDIAKKILRQNKFAMRVGFLYSKGGRILIKSSEEKAEPLEPKIKPDYDVKISWNTNKSVAVSYFVPLKSKKAAIVPINVDNELVFLKISYGEKTDVIFINNTKKPIKFKGMICQKKAIIIHNGKKYEM
jgi:hypothetical protein